MRNNVIIFTIYESLQTVYQNKTKVPGEMGKCRIDLYGKVSSTDCAQAIWTLSLAEPRKVLR